MTMTRRDFLSASAALAAMPALGGGCCRAGAARRRHRRDRRGCCRHCCGAADHGGEPQGDRGGGGGPDRRPLRDRRVDFRGAVRPRRAMDAQSRDQSDDQARRARRARNQRRRRRVRRSASAAAMRAPARPKNSSPLWCAPTAPSTTPRARADISCAAVLPKDLGDWAGTAEFVLGAEFRRQGSEGCLGGRQGARAGSHHRDRVPPGAGHADRKARRAAAGVAVDAGEPHFVEQPRRHGGNTGWQDHRARRCHHGIEQCARCGQHQIRARHPEARARCRRQIEPRQLRPDRAADAGQSARLVPRRHLDRAEQFDPHRAALCQYGRFVACARSMSRARSVAICPPRASRR